MKKLAALLALCLPLLMQAQVSSPEEALEKYAKYPQEKVYLKFDKGDYLAGETSRFKAYIFSGTSLSRISTNLYVEVLDSRKRVIYSNLFPVATGIAEGAFVLPKNLPEDVYYFHAYTSWMLNWDDRFHFLQSVNVYNPASLSRLAEQPVAWKGSVQAEGGNLLDNVEAQVAVRLHAQGRLPQSWSGYLFDNADTTVKIAEFRSLTQDAASFRFIPGFGKSYSIRIKDDNQHTETIPLPAVAQQGATLQAAQLSKGIAYRLRSVGLPNQLKDFKILAQSGGEVLYSALIKGSKDEINGTIPLDSSFCGLVHLTLFDPSGNAVAQRLVFAHPDLVRTSAPGLQFSKITSAKRGLNQWDIQVDTSNLDSYSVEVLNAATPVPENNSNLFTTLYLGDLSALPYNSASYFSPDGSVAADALDAYLIGENWDRFNWSTLLTKGIPKPKYLPDNFLTFEGTATRGKKILANKEVNMIFQMRDSSKIFMMVKTDSAGKFILRNMIFRDTAKVYFQVNTQRASATNIEIDFKRIEAFKPLEAPLPVAGWYSVRRKDTDTIPQRVKEYSAFLQKKEEDDNRYKTMQTVVVKSTKVNATAELNKKLSTGMFQSLDENVYDFVNEEQDAMGYGSILEWLRTKVPGMTIQMQDGNEIPMLRGSAMKIYQDEFPLDPSMVSSIPISDIAMVKVMKTNFMLGGSTIAIYTYRGGITPKNAQPTLPTNTLVGYPVRNNFKETTYVEDDLGGPADTRSVLYWNTSLAPEKEKASIRFYNNDISQNLRLIVIGFTRNGTPVYLNKEIALDKK